jgi:phage tail-like protein
MIAPIPNNLTTQQSNALNSGNAAAGAITSEYRAKEYVLTNRFFVEMGGGLVAAFSECSGISAEREKLVYHEGGVNDQQRISLGHTNFSDVTLKRGLTKDKDFTKWFGHMFKFITVLPPRRNVTIVTFNQAGETIRSWTLIGAIPVGLKLPSLEADGDTVAVEELTLAFESLRIGKQSFGGYPMIRDFQGNFGYSKWK